MKRKHIYSSVKSLIILVGVLGLISCIDSPVTITGIDDKTTEATVTEGIPADQMTWIPWKPEVIDHITFLAKEGSAGRWVLSDEGGTVGGVETFNNKVGIPGGAPEEDTYISVDVVCIDEGQQCGAEVDFLPDGTEFEYPAKVTLSWEYLDYEGGYLDFLVYYSENGGVSWSPVDNPAEVDYDNMTVSVNVDHFTRFAWAL